MNKEMDMFYTAVAEDMREKAKSLTNPKFILK